ncbi:uncharacterized protein LOC129235178 [Uloborus diversus]|uniref:uncharacterized protein LOC129235178 n=1 Tax=Uloborus diversus TaxID=327109 RepID=UPI00240A1F27|nr:uncharacterized protein LOC129235178 [Uloborus diversus]XP_054724848.1 uncharacterized protein LOC129235178 [Uloborus diversus]
MSERRVSGWFVMSAVFLVAVFGLFFTFTERKTWPEQRVELTATDMRLAPPASTLWCEAVTLHSDHPFVAYQLSQGARINSKHLSHQRVNLQLKLGSTQRSNSLKLKYFLLSSSVIEIVPCSSVSGALLMIFQGEQGVPECLQSFSNQLISSNESVDSDEISSEEDDFEFVPLMQISERLKNKYCSSLLKHFPIRTSYMDGSHLSCSSSIEVSPVKINVSTSDSYVIAVLNTNRQVHNEINLQIFLERSKYTVQKTGQTFDMCSLSTTCTIGLGFGTSDRVLLWIPDEANAGRTSFTIRSRCKPRLAVFAILSVFLPLIVFLVVAFVVRADTDRIKNLYNCRSRNRNNNQQRRVGVPLLREAPATPISGFDAPTNQRADDRGLQSAIGDDELPPPYHTLYEPPPPYSGLKREATK